MCSLTFDIIDSIVDILSITMASVSSEKENMTPTSTVNGPGPEQKFVMPGE